MNYPKIQIELGQFALMSTFSEAILSPSRMNYQAKGIFASLLYNCCQGVVYTVSRLIVLIEVINNECCQRLT